MILLPHSPSIPDLHRSTFLWVKPLRALCFYGSEPGKEQSWGPGWRLHVWSRGPYFIPGLEQAVPRMCRGGRIPLSIPSAASDVTDPENTGFGVRAKFKCDLISCTQHNTKLGNASLCVCLGFLVCNIRL